MDKKSKILLWFLALLIIASVGATYWRIMVKKDYVIEAQIDCDPYEDACFVWECDPESTVEGEACTGDPELDVWYFSVAARKAANIPLCNPETDEDCDPWTCEDGEKKCSETFCSEELMAAQYASACVDPIQFVIDNPVEEDVVECEESDEECLALQSDEIICDLEEDPTCVIDDMVATEDEGESESAEFDVTE
ncbi:MAG TPA: hypothetical protein DEA43_01085 [Candidatus Moranbacteria bacterium]|nr:hypothetical protein [Candidatus Moranbacteria bacterium]HBT45464.1 hypothetical protein [Candidatus Moranbacteria bacterium]